MPQRDRIQSAAKSNLVYLLNEWRHRQPVPRGVVLSDDVEFDIPSRNETRVEIDVADVPAETIAAQTNATVMLNGVPVLAIEIESPTHTYGYIHDRINEHIATGVKQVWVVDPHFHTVRVHHPGQKTEFFTNDEDLVAEPDLPGFRVRVAQLFE